MLLNRCNKPVWLLLIIFYSLDLKFKKLMLINPLWMADELEAWFDSFENIIYIIKIKGFIFINFRCIMA